MVTNTGTNIYCPFHRFADGSDTAQTALKDFVQIDALMIHIPFTDILKITEDYLKSREIRNKTVLTQNSWDIHWNSELYY